MRHRHEFAERDGATSMTDVFEYEAPLGPLGRAAEVVFLDRYMRAFLRRRADALKDLAEAQGTA